MRPLRLEFRAFGAFPGTHVVDFDALGRRGLFVVSGPTGAGKTMIFDAMVYALYGVLPGGRAADGEARSHHAEAHVETYVQLDFEVDGECYRVHRTPKWERPKVRGHGTTEQPPTAHLVRLHADGTEAVATQLSRVTEECVRLVGLDSRQFQRVVLLPQGKFADFLTASDEVREVLLRQLFGGELYEQATKLLKVQLEALEREVGQADEQLRHHRRNAATRLVEVHEAWVQSHAHAAPGAAPLPAADEPHVPDVDELAVRPLAALRELAAATEPMRHQHQAVLTEARRAATELAGRRKQADDLVARATEAASMRHRLAELEASATEMDASSAAVEASRRARPVVAAGARLAAAQEEAEAAGLSLDELRALVVSAFDALGRTAPPFDPAAVATAVAEADQHVAEHRRRLQEALQAGQAATRAAAHATDVEEQKVKMSAVVAEVQASLTLAQQRVEALRPLAGQSVRMQVAHSDAGKRLDTRRRLTSQQRQHAALEADADRCRVEYEQVMARFVATQAPRLAAGLEPGHPCPVCGSCEHPAKAVQEPGESVDHQAVDAARGRWTAATQKASSCALVIASLRESLGAAVDRSEDELAAEVDAAAAALRAAQEADAALEGALHDVAALTERVGAAQADEAECVAAAAAAAEAAAITARAAHEAAQAAEGIEPEVVEAQAAVLASLRPVTAGMAALFQRSEAARSAVDVCEAALREELVTQAIGSVEEAAALLMPEREELRAQQLAERWHTARTEAAARLAALEELGVPAEVPDVEAIRAEAVAAEQRATALAAAFTTASNALTGAVQELDAAAEVEESTAELRARRDTARVVFHTCNGESGKRVKLERWVLATELDRVTAAANEHLARMSTHRYQLGRVLGVRGGLTLEVLDAHTGRSRPTGTLSGGEQFQASLALALGLADVVSRGGTGSGKQFEALFVDEGFGTLDPDALDDAIAALASLQAAGRMVGAITHVEAMKQQLHVGIEVRPLTDGRGSTLVVHP